MYIMECGNNKDEQHVVPALKELNNVNILKEAWERLLLINKVGSGKGSIMEVTFELILKKIAFCEFEIGGGHFRWKGAVELEYGGGKAQRRVLWSRVRE